jgi:predicted alpha/beta superfamily hydrolase
MSIIVQLKWMGASISTQGPLFLAYSNEMNYTEDNFSDYVAISVSTHIHNEGILMSVSSYCSAWPYVMN